MPGESKRNQPEKDKAATDQDALAAVHNLAGQTINAALAAFTGFDAKSLVEKLPPDSVASYMRGKKLDAADPNLSQQERADVQVYKTLHDSLTAKIPFYDHDAFVNSMENEMHVKTAPDAASGVGYGAEAGAASDTSSGVRAGAASNFSGAATGNSSEPSSGVLADTNSNTARQSDTKHNDATTLSSPSPTAQSMATSDSPESGLSHASKFAAPQSIGETLLGDTLSSGKSRAAQTGNFDDISAKNRSLNKSISPDFGSDKSAPITWNTIVESPSSSSKPAHATTLQQNPINDGNTNHATTIGTSLKPDIQRSQNADISQSTESNSGGRTGQSTESGKPFKSESASSNYDLTSSQSLKTGGGASFNKNVQSNRVSADQSAKSDRELCLDPGTKPDRQLTGDGSTKSDRGLTSDRSILWDRGLGADRSTNRDGAPSTDPSTKADDLGHSVYGFDKPRSPDTGLSQTGRNQSTTSEAKIEPSSPSNIKFENRDHIGTIGDTTPNQVRQSEQLAKFEKLLYSNGIACIRWQNDFRFSVEAPNSRPQSELQGQSSIYHVDSSRNDPQTGRLKDSYSQAQLAKPNTADLNSHHVVAQNINLKTPVLPQTGGTDNTDRRSSPTDKHPDHKTISNDRGHVADANKGVPLAIRQNTVSDTKSNHSNEAFAIVHISGAQSSEHDAKGSSRAIPTLPHFEGILQNSTVSSKLEAFITRGQKTKFDACQKRFVLGSEIALAVIIAAAGATRIRGSGPKGPRAELIPGSEEIESTSQTIFSTSQFEGTILEPSFHPSTEFTATAINESNVPPIADGNVPAITPSNIDVIAQSNIHANAQCDSHTGQLDIQGKTQSGVHAGQPDIQGKTQSGVHTGQPDIHGKTQSDLHLAQSDMPAMDESTFGSIKGTSQKDQKQELIAEGAPDEPLAKPQGDDLATEEKPSLADPLKRNNKGKSPTMRPKTLIASTDTLTSIAEAFFYDRNIAWLIADLNQNHLKESWMDGKRIVELKTRQQIELPLWSDIEEFYRTRPEYAKPENLVTIVEQTSIDAELLNSSLKKLMSDE